MFPSWWFHFNISLIFEVLQWDVIAYNSGKNIAPIINCRPNNVSTVISFDKPIVSGGVTPLASNVIQHLIMWVDYTPFCIPLILNVSYCVSSILVNLSMISGDLSSISLWYFSNPVLQHLLDSNKPASVILFFLCFIHLQLVCKYTLDSEIT